MRRPDYSQKFPWLNMIGQSTYPYLKTMRLLILSITIYTLELTSMQLNSQVIIQIEKDKITYHDFNLTGYSPTTLAGNPAYRKVYSFPPSFLLFAC